MLYGLFSLLIALLLISYLMPNWQLRNIRVTRRFINDFTVDKPGSITYLFEVRGSRYHVELMEYFEFAEFKEQCFFFGKISGRISCKLQFNCLQRGCFRLRKIQLSSAYPFGIVKFTKSFQTEPMELLVFPKVFELSRIPMPLVADTTTWGEVRIPQKGGRDEFTAVREYVHGDELNRIHWPVSARHQNLVVKEYEKTDRPAMLIVLDCCQNFNVGQGHLSTFESAVSIAASMIQFASRQGFQCFLVARNGRLQKLTIQAYSADLYTLYESLARLNCNDIHPYNRVVEQAQKQFPQANLITTFRLDSDTTQPNLSPHMTQIDMEMDKKSFYFPKQSGAKKGMRQEGNRLIYSVSANQQLENLFQ